MAMPTEPPSAYQRFVGGLVQLDAAQQQRDDAQSPFASLADRIAGHGGGWQFSSFVGGGMLAGAALLAAVLPSTGAASNSFWRVGRSTVVDVLAVGNAVVVPLALAALALLVLSAAAVPQSGQAANRYLAIQPFIGSAGLLGVTATWAGFLALALANLAVLMLIILAYVVATIFFTALVIGFLIGLLNQ